MATTKEGNERLEFIYFVHENITDYIKFSDTKASILLAASGVLLTLVIGWWQDNFDKGLPFLFYLTCILLIGSFVMFFLSIYPRLKIQKESGLVFFECIANKNEKDYVKSVRGMKSEEILSEIAGDVCNLSKVAHKKYLLVKCGLIILGIALITASIFWFSTLMIAMPNSS